VATHFSADAQDRSARFQMLAICNPENKDKVDAAIADELDKLLRGGIDPKELAEAKKAYLAQKKVRRGSDAALVALLHDGLVAGRTLDYQADQEKQVAELTPEKATEAFRKYIDPKRLVIIQAGDFKKKGGGTP
jgi:zinc protease